MLSSRGTAQAVGSLLRYGRCLPTSSIRYLSTEDSHDDFKPKYKGSSSANINEQIENDVKSNRVFVYMKGVPEAPQCGFSNMACRILDAYGVQYGSRDVIADPNLREGIKKFTQWPTIPQVFIDGEFVGGSDILLDMHNKGELEKLFLQNKKS